MPQKHTALETHLELASLGITRQLKLPQNLTWLRDSEKLLLLELYWAGEAGLHKSYVNKMEKKAPDTLFNVTVHNYAEWLTDKAGRPVALALTWQGDEVAKLLHQIALNESAKNESTAEG